MLKRRIDKKEFDTLDDAKKELYSESATKAGEYLLAIEDDDTSALRLAKERETRRSAELKIKNDELLLELEGFKNKADDEDQVNARKKGDIAALEKSWQAKLDTMEKKYKEILTKREAAIGKLLVDKEAEMLAKEISNSPSLILPHIKSRLVADLDGDEPITRIIGTDGKPSALNIADLKKELLANKEFAVILIGSRASGGGAGDTRKAESGATGKPFDKLTDAERIAFYKENPEGFKEAVKASRAA